MDYYYSSNLSLRQKYIHIYLLSHNCIDTIIAQVLSIFTLHSHTPSFLTDTRQRITLTWSFVSLCLISRWWQSVSTPVQSAHTQNYGCSHSRSSTCRTPPSSYSQLTLAPHKNWWCLRHTAESYTKDLDVSSLIAKGMSWAQKCVAAAAAVAAVR